MKRKSSRSDETSTDSSTPSTNAPDCPPVTSSSPTPSSSASQAYHQQLEAMLAAVNSHGTTPITHEGLLAAAAAAAASAAAAANTGATADTHSPQRQSFGEMDQSKRDNIRASNRERKKKWRLQNEERNKDNDLRCRVNKRANKLFGIDSSLPKEHWIEEEFERRKEKRQKRMDRDRRKDGENVSGQVPSSIASSSSDTMYYPPDLPQQLLEHLNHMMALTNGKLPENLAQFQGSQSPPVVGEGSDAAVSKKEEPTDSNDTMDVDKKTQAPSSSTSTSSSGRNSPAQYNQEKGGDDNADAHGSKKGASSDGKESEYPAEAILTLMHLNAGWQK